MDYDNLKEIMEAEVNYATIK